MDQEKVGNFIKQIRKDNKLTQKALAKKLGVTYQAVSKWETGKSIPDIGILKEISNLFNVDIDEILDGEKKEKEIVSRKHNKIFIALIFILVILSIFILYLILNNKNDSFEFKTLSSDCESFELTGSLAYNSDKTSIYISNIIYCGDDDTKEYKKIECKLYEDNNNVSNLINECKSDNNVTLKEYLKNVKFNVNDYSSSCKVFKDSKLYLQIDATDQNNKILTYKVPLSINNNCSYED